MQHLSVDNATLSKFLVSAGQYWIQTRPHVPGSQTVAVFDPRLAEGYTQRNSSTGPGQRVSRVSSPQRAEKCNVSNQGGQGRQQPAGFRKNCSYTNKQLIFVEPDVVGFQAVVRGALARREYEAWRDYLHRSHPHATILQAMLRGLLQRRQFRARMQHYRDHLDSSSKSSHCTVPKKLESITASSQWGQTSV